MIAVKEETFTPLTYRRFVNLAKDETITNIRWEGTNPFLFCLFCVAVVTTQRNSLLEVVADFTLYHYVSKSPLFKFSETGAVNHKLEVHLYSSHGYAISTLLFPQGTRLPPKGHYVVEQATIRNQHEGSIRYARYNLADNRTWRFELVDYDLLCQSALGSAQGFMFHPGTGATLLNLPAFCAFLETTQERDLHVFSPRSLNEVEGYIVNEAVRIQRVTWLSCDHVSSADTRYAALCTHEGLRYLRLVFEDQFGAFSRLLQAAVHSPSLEVLRLSFPTLGFIEWILPLMKKPRMKEIEFRSFTSDIHFSKDRKNALTAVSELSHLSFVSKKNPVILRLLHPLFCDPFLQWIRESTAGLQRRLFREPNAKHVELVTDYLLGVVSEANRRKGCAPEVGFHGEADTIRVTTFPSEPRARWKQIVQYAFHVFCCTSEIYEHYRNKMRNIPRDWSQRHQYGRAIRLINEPDIQGINNEHALRDDAMIYYVYLGYRYAMDINVKEFQGLPDEEDPTFRAFQVLNQDNGKDATRLIQVFANGQIKSFLPPDEAI
jgi:hypothetical protein